MLSVTLTFFAVLWTIAIGGSDSDANRTTDPISTFRNITVAGSTRTIWDNKVDITDGLVLSFSMDFSSSKEKSDNNKEALKVFLGESLIRLAKQDYTRTVTTNKIHMTFYGGDTNVILKKTNFHDQCYQIEWTSGNNDLLQDCFDTSSSHWFGLGEMLHQRWPLNDATLKMQPFVTTDFLSFNKGFQEFGGVLEPLVVNSNGGGVYVFDTVPLYVSMNANGGKKLCFGADNTNCDSRYVRTKSSNHLKYTICVADNIKDVRNILASRYIQKPQGIPDTRMIAEPIWSTWPFFKKLIDQEKILKFADQIKEYGFNVSHLIIEDKYSTNHGDFNFNPETFTDSVQMIDILRSLGFRIMVWITPFCSLDSRYFRKGFNHWLRIDKDGGPAILKWWNGYGTILDTTSVASKKWFQERLKNFQKMKIDGFKFDGGEVSILPATYTFKTSQQNPNHFSHYYVKMASEVSKLVEVRVGYKSQKFPVFVRLLDRRSAWVAQGGLRSIIPATLTLSILGYPFVLPDMIGGNNYISNPSKELYVRWVQLAAFLPSMQFSIPPWQFGKAVINYTQEALKIRNKLSRYMIQLAQDVQHTGSPIIRPLWWLWPKDRQTFTIDREFMLGDKYLIAPVVNSNIIKHTVYLPAGVWEEQWGKRKILHLLKGQSQIYGVTLSDICYFRLVHKTF